MLETVLSHLKVFCTYAFLRDLFRLAPRKIHSATCGPFPEIVIENVADAKLDLVVSREIRRRMEGFGKWKSYTKGQSYMET